MAACTLWLVGCGGNSGNVSNDEPGIKAQKPKSKTALTADDYADSVQELYIAYFGRPADPTGLGNFEASLLAAGAPNDIQSLVTAYDTNPAVKKLVDAFGVSTESQTLYGGGNTDDFVTAVFTNVLGRAPQASGLSYWSGAISSGSLSQGNAALSIMAGALANTSAQGQIDAQLIDNRIAVAQEFTYAVSYFNNTAYYKGPSAAGDARTMLAAVNATTNTSDFTTTADNMAYFLANFVSLATSAPTPNYPSGDVRLTIFNTLNSYRQLAGVGLLTQDPLLDQSAANHANYVVLNNAPGHYETAGNPGYTGNDPYYQSLHVGENPQQFIGQVIAFVEPSIAPNQCLEILANTVYHLQNLVGGQQTIGSAIDQWTCAINTASQAGAPATGGFYGTDFSGQEAPDNVFIKSPLPGETVLGQGMPYGESPNPIPDITTPVGHPVMFMIPRGVTLNVSSFTLTDAGGNSVACRLLVSSASVAGSTSTAVQDPAGDMFPSAAFLIPLAPLEDGTYTASFSGGRGDTGLDINATWSFHVGANWILPGQTAILFRERWQEMPRQWPRGHGGVM
jgi:uncharacterized protein YkwD